MTTATPTPVNRQDQLFDEVRHGFFHTAIGDIYRSIKGGCFVGTFTLTCCAIAALSELEWAVENQDKLYGNVRDSDRVKFTGWLQRWVKDTKINPSCDPEFVYAVRCSLAHSYGTSDRLRNQNIGPFTLTRGEQATHYQRDLRPSGKTRVFLNMEDFVAESTLAAVSFVESLPEKWKQRCDESMERYVKDMLLPVVQDEDRGPSRLVGMFAFGEIHPALAAPLNSLTASSDKQQIVDAINVILTESRS